MLVFLRDSSSLPYFWRRVLYSYPELARLALCLLSHLPNPTAFCLFVYLFVWFLRQGLHMQPISNSLCREGWSWMESCSPTSTWVLGLKAASASWVCYSCESRHYHTQQFTFDMSFEVSFCVWAFSLALWAICLNSVLMRHLQNSGPMHLWYDLFPAGSRMKMPGVPVDDTGYIGGWSISLVTSLEFYILGVGRWRCG